MEGSGASDLGSRVRAHNPHNLRLKLRRVNTVPGCSPRVEHPKPRAPTCGARNATRQKCPLFYGTSTFVHLENCGYPSPPEPNISASESTRDGEEEKGMNLPEFRNEPLSNFKGDAEQFRQMQEAVNEVHKELGREYNLVIGGRRIKTEEKFQSENPAQKGEVVGVVAKATARLAEEAIRLADETFKTWSRTPVIGYKFLEILEQAGMPPGVVNFLPGPGGTVGNALVAHPRTRFVAFTGSKEVGLGINELAAKHVPGQIWIKRVVAEMGGKDSIVVDSDADLDAAVEGVAASAFGYQGQKCSACSRAIIAESVYDDFLAKLKQRVERIQVGPPADPASDMGPVINEKAKKSILNYIETGKKEGRLVTGGREILCSGYYIEPTVIADVAPQGRIAQEEIFGPVLAVIKARNFDEALDIANNTEYGLTGAVYTTDGEKLAKAAST